MGIILVLISLFYIYMGIMLLYKPDSVLGMVKLYADEIGFQVMKAVGGILFGVFLMVYASHSNLPGLLMFLGAISLIAGAALFVVKPEQFSGMMRKAVTEYADYARIAGGVATVIGLILLYAAW